MEHTLFLRFLCCVFMIHEDKGRHYFCSYLSLSSPTVMHLCGSYLGIWDTSSLTRERNSFKMGEGFALR